MSKGSVDSIKSRLMKCTKSITFLQEYKSRQPQLLQDLERNESLSFIADITDRYVIIIHLLLHSANI